MNLRPLFADIDSLLELLAEDVAILTPNRRLSRAVREAETLHRCADREEVWATSTILPLRQYWIERWRRAVTRGLLPARNLVDTAAQRLIWRRVIDTDSQNSFSLLSPSRAARLCQEARETLGLWRIDLQDANIQQAFSFDEDSRAFLRWNEAFCGALTALNALTPEQALEELLACPAALDQAVGLLSQEDLPPLHQALCEATPAWHHIVPPRSEGSILPTRTFTDSRAELQMAAKWCREKFESDAQGRYAVVLSDMQQDRDRLEFHLRQEFDCLTQNYASLPVNFATGFRLDEVPLVRDALRILELSLPEVYVETVIAVLQSRFVRPIAFRVDKRERSVRRLRELARERVPQTVMRSVLDDLFDKDSSPPPWDAILQMEANGAWQKRPRAPSQWLEPIKAILHAWGWALGATLDSLEYQQAVQWQEALDKFARLDAFTGVLTLSEAIQSLKEVLGEEQFQPRTDDHAVQVLGPLETTGLQFDALWITGMSADRWPAGAQANPYLPHGIQKQQRMPHADAAWEHQWATARWLQWVGGAKELQASYVSQVDGTDALPSPLLQGVPETTDCADWLANSRWLEQSTYAKFDEVPIEPVVLGSQERVARGVGTQVLEQQSLCPFQAFAATRLGAMPLPAPAAGLLASERGTLLHRALFDLWGEIKDRAGLVSLQAPEVASLIDSALVYAEQGLQRERVDILGEEVLALERDRLTNVLLRWLALESERSEDFTVVAREESREYELAGLQLRMRLDRVDELGDGSRVIIDYKSGSPGSVNQWLGDRPTRPQLPLYALLEPFASGISYASLKAGEEGFKGIGERAFEAGVTAAEKHLSDDEEGGIDVLREGWSRALSALAREFIDGHSVVTPTTEGCRYCQRFSLCRMGEQ